MGFGGLTLAHMLRAENAAGTRSSSTAVINIHLDGGPPQMELIDPNPDAPSEIRGEFGSIRTKIPGFHVTELLPSFCRGSRRMRASMSSSVRSWARTGSTTPSSASRASRKRIP